MMLSSVTVRRTSDVPAGQILLLGAASKHRRRKLAAQTYPQLG
jgi:hypothetical protein